jgi:hypothetical protein
MEPANEYLKFVRHVEALVIHGINQSESQMHAREKLLLSASKVFERLQSPSAKVIFANAFSQMEPEAEEALVAELVYITSNIGRVFGENQSPDHSFLSSEITADEHDRDLASAAKTGKDSLEKILEKWLPDWIKTRLTILNEILSIVFKL